MRQHDESALTFATVHLPTCVDGYALSILPIAIGFFDESFVRLKVFDQPSFGRHELLLQNLHDRVDLRWVWPIVVHAPEFMTVVKDECGMKPV